MPELEVQNKGAGSIDTGNFEGWGKSANLSQDTATGRESKPSGRDSSGNNYLN